MRRATTHSQTLWWRLYAVAGLCILILLGSKANLANGEVQSRHGQAMSRGLFYGPSGKPIFAEYKSSREIIQEYGEATGPLEDAFVMNVENYNAIIDAYEQFLAENRSGIAAGATVMTKEDYLTKDFGTVRVPITNPKPGEPAYQDLPVPKKKKFSASTRSVLVRANATIPHPDVLPKGEGNVLFEAQIDLRPGQYKRIENPESIEKPIRSLLLNSTGEVKESSRYTIGFKTAFLEDPEVGFSERVALGPIKYAMVETTAGSRREPTYTNEEGKYGLSINLPPCPGFSYSIDFSIWLRIPYQGFDPEARHPLDYHSFSYPDGYVCSSSSSSAILTNNWSKDFLIDMVLLTGKGRLIGTEGAPIPQGATTYGYAPPPLNRIDTPNLDLNADRQTDATVDSTANPNYSNVYLDGASTDSAGNPIAPDLQRVRDIAPDFSDQGLLKSISFEDLKDTDVYIYRVATGQRVFKIAGLYEQLISKEAAEFAYRYTIPGPTSHTFLGFLRQGTGIIKRWQEELGLPQDMIGIEGDFMRTGEQLRLIAINRATGYIASTTTTIQPPTEGLLNFEIQDLKLQPPNLKVQVDRVYTVQSGLSKGDQKDYTIGFEGSALTTDTMVSVSTEWFDHDGSPLPDDLEGYTGRLAKVTGANSLAGGTVDTFDITPGKHLQVLKLEGDILGSEHFYVHVFGDKPWDVTTGAGNGPLQFRPDRYVPIKVPIFDEAATRLARNTNTYNQQDSQPSLSHVDAVYRWPYRPEMQFSVFDLTVNELRVTDADGGTSDLLNSPTTINTTDQSLQLFYDLLANSNAPLATFGPARELIFAVGGDEQLATTQAGQSLTYTNLAHLAELSSSDLLSIRLYQNSDMENVLWEFSLSGGLYITSSDNPGSDQAHSFVITTQAGLLQSDGSTLKYPQDPFTLQLVDRIEEGDSYRWEIEVPDVDKYGHFQFTSAVPTTQTITIGTDNPKTYTWASGLLTDPQYRELAFRPVELNPRHTPAAYTRNTGGTREIDVQQKNPQYTYNIKVTVNSKTHGRQIYTGKIQMDHKDMIRQEYITHYAFTDGSPQRRINCIRGSLANAQGYCSSNNTHLFPTRDDFATPVATTNYTVTGGCRPPNINCLTLVAANYNATVAAPGYTFGVPLDYAESIRTQYITDLGFVTTPIITSGWRNPERNERVGGVINSNHQWGTAIDLVPEDDAQSFPVIHTSSSPDAAATTWCQLAQSSFSAGNSIETLIENTRTVPNGGRPAGASSIYYRWSTDSALTTCVTDVRNKIQSCTNLILSDLERNRRCSPNHVHTARQ